MSDRVFLDANVLFSAAWRETNGLLRLWQRPHVQLLTSGYAVAEASRNLPDAARRQRLERLLASMQIVGEAPHVPVTGFATLRDKDRPILQAAIAARATHLLTGDLRDFGPWFGTTVHGVHILLPATYLTMPPKPVVTFPPLGKVI